MSPQIRSSGESSQPVTAFLDPEQAKALKRAIQDAGKAARSSVRLRLKEAGTVIQTEIRGRTPVYGGKSYGGAGRRRAIGRGRANYVKSGSHTPGLLRKSTRLKIGSLRVEVYNDAKAVWSKGRGGFYRYGKRLEFDPAYNGRYAFFYPGFEARRTEALDIFKKVLDDAATAYMKG